MTATLLTAAGTWAGWDMGYPADIARAVIPGEWDALAAELDGEEFRQKYRWQPIGYPASFGPIPPAAPGAPSYAASVSQGVVEGVRLINETPGPFILIGYSQGAEVTGRIELELTTGSLQHRLADCPLHITLGDPCRQEDDETIGGGDGWGISRLVIPHRTIRKVTYALPGDMYACTPKGEGGENMTAMYALLTQLGGTPLELWQAVMADDGLARQLMDITGKPLTGVVSLIQSLSRLVSFLQTQAHTSYRIDHAVQLLRELDI